MEEDTLDLDVYRMVIMLGSPVRARRPGTLFSVPGVYWPWCME